MSKFKQVLKYEDGEPVPLTAKYLCTCTEYENGSRWEPKPSPMNPSQEERIYFKKNIRSYHYYEVETERNHA